MKKVVMIESLWMGRAEGRQHSFPVIESTHGDRYPLTNEYKYLDLRPGSIVILKQAPNHWCNFWRVVK